MLGTQINDHLFPKVTAETILVHNQKGFYKTEKTRYQTPREVSKLGGSTEHPRPGCFLGGFRRLVLQGALGRGYTGCQGGVCPEHSKFTWGWGRMGVASPGQRLLPHFLAKIRLSYSLYHNKTDRNEEFFIVQNSHQKKASFQNNSFA